MKPKTFVVIGLGLMGGSLGLALRKYFRGAKVIGVSRSERKISFARKKKMIHAGTLHLRRALEMADLVFICTPVDLIPNMVSRMDRFAKPGTMVTDVGSTKGELLRWADRQRFKRIRFVGSHPLAGSHVTGPAQARADLFNDARVFVTPTRKTHLHAKRAVVSVWKRLGASVTCIGPDQHDRIVSQISHLPHAVAVCLMQLVSAGALRYRSTGFLDTTRIAQGDPRIWVPIFLSNRRQLLHDLGRFQRIVRRLTRDLERGARDPIGLLLQNAGRKRRARIP